MRILALQDDPFQLCPREQNLTSMPFSVLFTYLSVPLSETKILVAARKRQAICVKREKYFPFATAV